MSQSSRRLVVIIWSCERVVDRVVVFMLLYFLSQDVISNVV